jgi:hypothetical protein
VIAIRWCLKSDKGWCGMETSEQDALHQRLDRKSKRRILSGTTSLICSVKTSCGMRKSLQATQTPAGHHRPVNIEIHVISRAHRYSANGLRYLAEPSVDREPVGEFCKAMLRARRLDSSNSAGEDHASKGTYRTCDVEGCVKRWPRNRRQC